MPINWRIPPCDSRTRRRLLGRVSAAFSTCVPFVFLCLHELTIVRRIEVEKRPTRFEMLDEGLADGIGGTGGKRRHHEAADERPEKRHDLERAGGADAAGRRN